MQGLFLLWGSVASGNRSSQRQANSDYPSPPAVKDCNRRNPFDEPYTVSIIEFH
jgi:hypothetical protein